MVSGRIFHSAVCKNLKVMRREFSSNEILTNMPLRRKKHRNVIHVDYRRNLMKEDVFTVHFKDTMTSSWVFPGLSTNRSTHLS